MKLYTVSQIARRTGLTVRTLHHYEAKGLVAPARRGDAGYRLYGDAEIKRLQHIVSLKALGFSLDEIRACLDADAPSLGEALARQVGRLREAVVRQRELLTRLEHVAQRVAHGETIDAETLLSSIEASTIMEKYLTPDQMQTIRRRGEELGAERIRAVENEWPDVIAGMQAALRLKKDPASDEVQRQAGPDRPPDRRSGQRHLAVRGGPQGRRPDEPRPGPRERQACTGHRLARTERVPHGSPRRQPRPGDLPGHGLGR